MEPAYYTNFGDAAIRHSEVRKAMERSAASAGWDRGRVEKAKPPDQTVTWLPG